MYVGGNFFARGIFYKPSTLTSTQNRSDSYENCTNALRSFGKRLQQKKKGNGIEIEDVPMDPYIKSDISRFTWNGCSYVRAHAYRPRGI